MPERKLSKIQNLYWRRTIGLILSSLILWLVFTVLPLALSDSLSGWVILGWPASFALAAFVVPLLYLLIIGLYCLFMDRFERLAEAETAETGDVS